MTKSIQDLISEYAQSGIYIKIMQALLEDETRQASVLALPTAWQSNGLAKLHAPGWRHFCTIVSNQLTLSLPEGELESHLSSQAPLSDDLRKELMSLLSSDNDIIRRTGGLVPSTLAKFGAFGEPLPVSAALSPVSPSCSS